MGRPDYDDSWSVPDADEAPDADGEDNIGWQQLGLPEDGIQHKG